MGSLKIYTIILIFSINYFHPVQCQVEKCCPIDFKLDISNFNKLTCKLSTNQLSRLQWDAYNILPPLTPHECDESRYDFIPDETNYIEFNGCIDKDSNEQYVAVSCAQDSTNGVHLMNKCCPFGKFYDHTERFCKQSTSFYGNFKHLFGNVAVLFKNKVPDCLENEVFVEYFSTPQDVQFDGTNVIVDGNYMPSNKFCIDDVVNINSSESTQDIQLVIRSCRPRSICNEIPCYRRCCKTDQVLKKSFKAKQCVPSLENKNLIPVFYDVETPVTNPQRQISLKDYGVLHSWKCNRFIALHKDDPEELHYLHKNGMLYVDKEIYDADSYCIENTLSSSNLTEVNTFICFDDQNHEELIKFSYYPYGLSISCVFLAITLAVYLIIPKLFNLHGKTVFCYVGSYFFAYVTLAVLQFNKQDRSSFCYEAAFLLLFCLMAVFCWQTIMCLDIWITIGSLRSSIRMHSKSNRRKFLVYSLYGFGAPLIWTLFALIAEKFKPLPENWNPSVTSSTCFFNNEFNWRNHFLFFLLPAGIHVIIDCVLFVVTAVHCSRIKSDIHRMQCIDEESKASTKRKKFIASKEIFILNLKLFTLSGTSWILEIISTFSSNQTIQIILDSYTIFYGVFIFIIFVFKWTIWRELIDRLGFDRQDSKATTSRTTTTTNSGNINKRARSSDRSSPLMNTAKSGTTH